MYMENVNQDAMLSKPAQAASPAQGETGQIPDDSTMLNEEFNPTDLAGDADALPTTPTDEQEAATGNDGTGALSGSPNMEADFGNYGNADSLGNNDGTEPDPTMTDPVSTD